MPALFGSARSGPALVFDEVEGPVQIIWGIPCPVIVLPGSCFLGSKGGAALRFPVPLPLPVLLVLVLPLLLSLLSKLLAAWSGNFPDAAHFAPDTL
jgi:hypothetical protein